MTVAAFLIALGALVFVVSSVSMLLGTLLELAGSNPLMERYGDGPLADPEDPEVHHLSAS